MVQSRQNIYASIIRGRTISFSKRITTKAINKIWDEDSELVGNPILQEETLGHTWKDRLDVNCGTGFNLEETNSEPKRYITVCDMWETGLRIRGLR